MKNNKLYVYQELRKQIEQSLFDTKAQRCLSVMVKAELEELAKNQLQPTIFNRKRLLHLAEGLSYSEAEDKSKQQNINETQLNNAIERLIDCKEENRQNFTQIGYLPVVKTNEVGKGGRGYEKEFWLDIHEIEPQEIDAILNDIRENNIDTTDKYFITYQRIDSSKIKISWFAKLIFTKGELRMKSFTGYSFMIFLILLFFALIAMTVLIVLVIIFLPQQKNISLIGAFSILLMPIITYSIFKEFIRPLNILTINRVGKVPNFLFLSPMEDEADFEMYRKDNSSYARITRFVATCPICTAPIWLADGKLDQKAPLVGRCREAPHMHVYSFDRVTLKGYFLGHEGYIK